MNAYELAYNYRLYAQDVKPKFITSYRALYGASLWEAIQKWENASPSYMKEIIEKYKALKSDRSKL